MTPHDTAASDRPAHGLGALVALTPALATLVVATTRSPMADDLGQYPNEIGQLDAALVTSPPTTTSRRTPIGARARVVAARTKAEGAWGGGE